MTPTTTYRVQLHAGFTFEDARRIIPYLHALGVTDLYTSPVFTARSGSTHGYDVADPTRLSPELGGEAGWQALTDEVQQHGMGLVMDIVPNHMAASPENRWWWSVLENGPSSEYARFFDIVWMQSPTGAPMENRVLLPVLGNHYGSVLENQELQISLGEDGFVVNYWETRLPLDPKTYRVILEQRYGVLKERLATDQPLVAEYDSLIELTDEMPERHHSEPDDIERRRRETGRLKSELWRLYSEREDIRTFLDENLTLVNGTKEQPDSFDILDRLLMDQAYRLAFWRVASQEINYRRFFDVADLVSMRIEDDEVFAARHAPLVEMAANGMLTGLRIDHIDGLHDPQGYLDRLRAFIAPGTTVLPTGAPDFYVVVEKILAEGEDLIASWSCDGTTGYDFLNLVNGVLLDGGAVDELDALYRRVSGIDKSFAQIVYEQKRRVMAELFSGDVRALVVRLDRLSLYDRHGRDLTQRELGQALSEVAARFHVYRTYLRDYDVSEEDREQIEHAVAAALEARPDLRRPLRFLRRVLLLEFPSSLPESEKPEWLAFVMRWQQFSGPIMAKGHEDTALYIYHRLASVNDVGGEPSNTGVSVAEFHETNHHRLAAWPHTMNATSTHDTKRSEDVRARINVLSELPDEWAERIDRWRQLHERHKTDVEGQPTPEGNTEYLIYQTLVGAWPLHQDEEPEFRERLKAYLMKASREAKTYTNWINENSTYEAAVNAFIDAILDPANREFLDDFRAFQETIAWHGALNSLAQVVLKLTAPGVPDIYQGTDLWDLSLVDPDNRRPVDYERRRSMLEESQSPTPDLARMLEQWQDGCVKLHVIQRVLHERRTQRELFLDGEYLPLDVSGDQAEHVIAYARRQGDGWAVTIVPRLTARLAPGQSPLGDIWGDTEVELPDGAPMTLRDALTGADARPAGGRLRVASVLTALPVAVLVS